MTDPKITIPIEALAVFPPPGMKSPNTFTFSQDGRQLMYLFSGDDDNTQLLYALDTETGQSRVLVEPPGGGVSEENLSPEEELRRQRLRMLAVGITQYQCVKNRPGCWYP